MSEISPTKDSQKQLRITNEEMAYKAHHLLKVAARTFGTGDPGLLATLLTITAGHAIGIGVARDSNARFPDLDSLKPALHKGITIGEDFQKGMLNK